MKTLHISIRPRSPPAACAPDRPPVPPSIPLSIRCLSIFKPRQLGGNKNKIYERVLSCMDGWLPDRPSDWLTGQLDSTTVRQRGGAHSLANTHTFMHLAAACRILERMRHCDKMFLLLFFCLFVYTATAAATSGMRHAACVAHVAHTRTHTQT